MLRPALDLLGSGERKAPAPAERCAPLADSIVVCIEDGSHRRLIEEVFRTISNCKLLTVPNGEEGVALARATAPDLVLIDINLPDIPGDAVLRQLRLHGVSARCVAISASVMPAEIRAALECGFDDYWTKPFDVQEMRLRIAAALVPEAAPVIGRSSFFG